MAARQSARAVVEDIANKVHIKLRGLPTTAVPSDVRRLCEAAKIENVKRVDVDYRHFEPHGFGWITLTTSEFMKNALTSLNSRTLAAFPVEATASYPPSLAFRSRGTRGRAEAAERGLMTGDGPTAGTTGSGRNVVIAGLPGRLSSDALKQLVRNFKLAGTTSEGQEISKIELPEGQFSLLSRHLIRLSTKAEAYRLVRRLHQTYYMPELYSKRYPIRARIIY